MSIVQAKNANQGELFSAAVRSLRQECELSQDELATELGISRNYVSMLEIGKKEPSAQLRKAFEVFAEGRRRRKKMMQEIVERDEAQMRQNLRDEPPADVPIYSRRQSVNPASKPPPPAPALAAVSKINEEELLRSIERSVQQFRDEKSPVMRIGSLHTIRTVLEILERRLAD